MQRWTAFGFAALTAAALAAVVVAQRSGPGTAASGVVADAGVADAAREAGPTAAASAVVDAGAPADAEAPAADEPLAAGPGGDEPRITSDAGLTLPNGELVPPLPAEAPKSVTFGVILVTYKGAQGAAPTARPRDEALALARQLAEEAKTDFKAALAKGDKGSLENAGRMPRGMLEPAPEYVLFTLPKDGVSDPVDTPRGFWIVRRID